MQVAVSFSTSARASLGTLAMIKGDVHTMA